MLYRQRLRLASGDTNSSSFALNAGGSKITYTVGPAVIQAVTELRRQTLEVVSDLLEVAAEDLEIIDGMVQVKGSPDIGMPLK